MPESDNALDLLADLIARAQEGRGRCRRRDAGRERRPERDPAPRQAREGRARRGCDLGLRVFVGKRQALVATGDLESASLDRLVENALAIARAVPEDRYAGLAEPTRSRASCPRSISMTARSPAPRRWRELAAAAEDAALAHPKITNSEGAEAGWSRSRTTLVASNGFVGSTARSSHSLSAAVIAAANGAMERDYEFATVVRAKDLPEAAEIGRRAAERAARRLNPRKVKSQSVPVVFDPRVAGGIVRHLASAISGPAVARGTTFLKDHLGERIFPAGVTIVDDPLRPNGLRSRGFDAEGIAATRRKLIDDGVLDDLAAGLRLGAPARPRDHRATRRAGSPRRPRQRRRTPISSPAHSAPKT